MTTDVLSMPALDVLPGDFLYSRQLFDDRDQPGNCRFPVKLLAAKLLRFNHYHTLAGDQVMAGGKQAFFIILWQAGGPNVKAQMDSR